MSKKNDAATPIRRPVAFEEKHHVQAEPVLRRWGMIWLQVLRVTVLVGLLTAWLWIGELVYEDAMRPFHAPARTFHQMLWGFLPYGVWLPLAVWAWYRMLLAARKAWLEKALASGVHTVEYGPEGVSFWSDAARHFYRWDSFLSLANRRDVLVLRLNRAATVLLPKVETTADDLRQITDWKRDFACHRSPLQEPAPPQTAALALTTQLDYPCFVEALRMERQARAKVGIVVMRWVRIGIGVLVLLAFVALGIQGYRRGVPQLYWYWSTFGVPLFLLLIYLWAWTFMILLRRQVWRTVKGTTGRPQQITLGEEGVDVRSPTSLNQYAWSAFNTVEVGKRVLMVGVIGGAPVIIPRRQIPGDEAECIAYLRRHVINVTQAFPVEMAAPLQIEN